jgi:hypothetical protein
MGVSVSLVVIAAGAILAFAVTATTDGVDLEAVGWILMGVGFFGLIVSLIFWSTWGGFGTRSRTIIEDRRDSVDRIDLRP